MAESRVAFNRSYKSIKKNLFKLCCLLLVLLIQSWSKISQSQTTASEIQNIFLNNPSLLQLYYSVLIIWQHRKHLTAGLTCTTIVNYQVHLSWSTKYWWRRIVTTYTWGLSPVIEAGHEETRPVHLKKIRNSSRIKFKQI